MVTSSPGEPERFRGFADTEIVLGPDSNQEVAVGGKLGQVVAGVPQAARNRHPVLTCGWSKPVSLDKCLIKVYHVIDV
jgi:hypothetical protein